MQNETLKVRDMRQSDWFWAESLMLQSRINGSIKLVYFGLCMFANQHSQKCFPKISTLIRLSGVSKRSVIRSLNELERVRAISIKRSTGRGKSNEYTLLDLKGANLALIQKGAKTLQKKVPNIAQKGATTAPPTNEIEQTKEQSFKKLGSLKHLDAARKRLEDARVIPVRSSRRRNAE